MSLFDQFVEKPAIIIDIGHAYTKCGFANEPSPFAIIPTPQTNEGLSIFDITGSSPETDDDRDRKQALIDFVYKIYYKVLSANTRERKLVVVESIFTPSSFRRALAQVLFSNFQCLSVAFMPSHLAALYTLAVTRALVVDCGYVDCQVVPIAEGIPMCGLCDFASFGAKRVHEEIESLIRAYWLVSK